MRISKSNRSCIVLAFIALFVFVTVMAAPVFADTTSPEGSVREEETVLTDPAEPEAAVEDIESDTNSVQAPLDFVNGTPGTSGDGWTWDSDTFTLTLDGLKLDLTQYKGKPYTAAINLPAGSTVDVQGDSGIGLVESGHTGISTAGDLTIKGNKTLLIDAEVGAAGGIKADSNIQIGEGKNPQKGLQLEIKTTGLAIKAGGSLSVNGSDLLLDIVDTKGTYTEKYNGAMVIDGNGVASNEYAVDIQDSDLYIINQNDKTYKVSYGIYAGSGSVRMKYSDYRQIGDKVAAYYGIRVCNGSVDIISTDVEMQVWTYFDRSTDTKLISAESNGNKITLSDSMVKGRGDGKGLYAKGSVMIDSGSDVDITAADDALDTGAALSINASDVQLISTGTDKSAMNTAGAVTIQASEVYLSGKGSGSNGLYTTSTVNISGDSYVDAEGKLAAIQMITDSTDSPITLSDGLVALEGGDPQRVSSGNEWIYSEKTQNVTLADSSKQVVIATGSRLIFLEQPEDQIVDYPDGASFEVRMSREDKVASYQWYVRDIVGQVSELKGQSATTPELIIPSTDQRENRLTYYCVVTDTAGNKLVSKEAYLDAENKYTEYKTVLYVGEYAVNPGESLNIGKDTNPNIGSGIISLSSDGTTIMMNQVKLNNNNAMYDVRLSPSKGIRLARNQSEDERTDVEYKVILKGANEIVNSFKSDNGNGYTMDFMLFGEEKKGQSPTVIIDGESQGGTLRLKGGNEAIRAIADLEINADITVKPLKDGDTSYLDGLVTDASNTTKHDMTIGANHKLDLTTYGAGLDSSGSLTVGENTEINVDMTMPHLVGGSSAGTQVTEKGAIKACDDKLELKPNTKLNISCVTDPDIMTDVAGCYGLWLKDASLKADGSTINIGMTSKPYEDPMYVFDLYGISSNADVTLKNSSVSVSVDGDEWAAAGGGIVADADITMSNCKADISASGNMQACGMITDTKVTMDNCVANVAATADVTAYGIAPNKDLNVTAPKINVKTQYTVSGGSSYGVLGSNMKLDLSKPGTYIRSNATNADGLAFVANTGNAGNDKKSYDPSYKAKMIKGTYDVVQPQNAVVNIASIPGSVHKYMYVESFYNSKDTSKPANNVELAKIVKTVTVNTKTVTAKKLDAAVKKAGGNSKTVTTIVLGKKVKKISKGTFKNYKNAKTLVVQTKKLKKSSVKNSLKSSKISKVKVKVGSKKTNKKYVKKYKKIFTKKNAGKKVKVTL